LSEQPKTYAYSVYTKQSLTNGIIAIETSFHTDKVEEAKDAKTIFEIFANLEQKYKDKGYKVASMIPNNMKELANKKTEEKESK